MQSLGLDVSVLKDDGTEVEIGENVDYGETDMRALFNDDRDIRQQENYASHGFQTQEFNEDGELETVEDEEAVEEEPEFDESFDGNENPVDQI